MATVEDEEMVAIGKVRATIILLLSNTEYLLWGLFYSLQPPFYPQEAESKGATPSQYSFVFGMAYFSALLASPLFAQYGHHLGPKFLFLVGSLSQALVVFLFGLLDLVGDTTNFLLFSYILRFVYGVVDAGASSGAMAIAMKIFPNHIGVIVAATETAFGLGYSIGPAVGGLLYAWGGFQLPFVSLGLLGLIISIPIVCVVPHMRSRHAFNAKTPAENEVELRPDISVWTIVKNMDVLRPMSLMAFFFVGIGTVEALLSPYMETAGASNTEISLAFVLMGIFYMISAPIIGYVVDKFHLPLFLSFIGSLSSFVGFLLIGPFPLLQPFIGGPNSTLILLMTSLLGICTGIIVPITFVRCKRSITNMGCQDDIRTHIRVSGLWFSSFYLGNTVGPFCGGFLVELMGFAWTTTIAAFLMLIVGLIDVVFTKKDDNKREKYQQIPD